MLRLETELRAEKGSLERKEGWRSRLMCNMDEFHTDVREEGWWEEMGGKLGRKWYKLAKEEFGSKGEKCA